MGLVAASFAVLIGGGFGRAMWRRRWTIADTPTSDAAHVFVGTNEVTGRARPINRPIVAPYSGVEAVWYRSLLEKEVKNNKGSSWHNVGEETSSAPFWIEDDTGRVLIRPDGASVYATDRRRTSHVGKPDRYDGFSLMRQLAASESGAATSFLPKLDVVRYRSTEWILKPGDAIYVLGDASIRDDVVALEFAPGRGPDGRRRRLLVAAGDERRAARVALWQSLFLLCVLVAGAVALPAAVHAVATAADGGPQPSDPSTLHAVRGWMIVAAIVVIALLPVTYVGRLYNRLVDVRQRVEVAWSLIEVQLRRRHDLIPALARLVAAAAEYEQTTQVALASTRSGLPDAATLSARTEVDEADRAAARTLVARVEAHPELLVDENHRRLASELVATEDAVAFARTFYNDAVTVMRDRRERLPGSLLAWAVPVSGVGLWQPDEPEAHPSDAPPPVESGLDVSPA